MIPAGIILVGLLAVSFIIASRFKTPADKKMEAINRMSEDDLREVITARGGANQYQLQGISVDQLRAILMKMDMDLSVK